MTGERAPVRRVHVVGGIGSGKSTLALRIGERLGVAVHHLDELYRDGGGTHPARGEPERASLVESILAEPGWVTEGVHLGWTDPFVDGADLVVWLDTVGWAGASRRIVRRFVSGALRGRRGSTQDPGTTAPRRSPLRWLRDGVGHVRDLAGALADARAYYRSLSGTERLPETRALTEARLALRRGPLVHCRTEAEARSLLASLA